MSDLGTRDPHEFAGCAAPQCVLSTCLSGRPDVKAALHMLKAWISVAVRATAVAAFHSGTLTTVSGLKYKREHGFGW